MSFERALEALFKKNLINITQSSLDYIIERKVTRLNKKIGVGYDFKPKYP